MLAAQAALARAVALDSTMPEVRLSRAWLTYTLGEARPGEDAAIRRDVEYARRARPNDPRILQLLGAVARRQGRWDEALATYTRGADRNPRDELFPIELAGTYLRLRRYADAERWIARTAALAPAYPIVELQRSGVFLLQGDPAAARRTLEGGAARFGYRGMLAALMPRYHRTVVLVGGRLLDSLRALRLGDLPLDTAAYYLARADAASAAGDPSARAFYDSVLAVSRRRTESADASGLTQRAYALAGLGRRDAALRAADSALVLLPYERDAWRGSDVLEDGLRVAVRVEAWPLARARADVLLSRPSGLSLALFRADPAFAAARARPEFADLGAPR